MAFLQAGKTERAWQTLFEKYDIAAKVRRNGQFRISAEQIKEFREPRLMAKFDHRKNLPTAFKREGLGILPVTRGEYVIGPFELFTKLPDPVLDIPPARASLPGWLQSVAPESIASEPVALNCAWASGVLQRFLGEERLVPTLSGRMGARPFSFKVGGNDVAVDGAQIEIDAAYEGDGCVAVFEAKMDLAEDFIVRQLYYPFRHLSAMGLSKPVRTVFLTYSGGVFDLAEYSFGNPLDYNSALLVRRERHALAAGTMSREDLRRMLETSRAEPEPAGIPFPQADSFARVANLCERLAAGAMSKEDIEEAYGFDPRQADYYANAAAYLGLARRVGGTNSRWELGETGRRWVELPLSRRNAFMAARLLCHKAFRKALRLALEHGEVPSSAELRAVLLATNPDLGHPGSDTFGRRASTLRHWTRWLFALTDG